MQYRKESEFPESPRTKLNLTLPQINNKMPVSQSVDKLSGAHKSLFKAMLNQNNVDKQNNT